MNAEPACQLCGEPMPRGEEMFKFHGYSGSCPKPPLQAVATMQPTILLQSGHYFNFLQPEHSTFTVEDIGHALANVCRFAGHSRRFYSVAQHSVLVSRIVPPDMALRALFHDAAEAFLGDVTSPLKQLLPQYRELEARVETAVLQKLKLGARDAWSDHVRSTIKQADLVVLATEQRDLMPPHDDEWTMLKGVQPLDEPIRPLSPVQAFALFMVEYWSLKPRADAALEG